MGSVLPSLVEFITIDNMSKGFYSAEEWNTVGWTKLEQAAAHVEKWIKEAGVKGLKSEIISNREQNLTPLIFVEVEG